MTDSSVLSARQATGQPTGGLGAYCLRAAWARIACLRRLPALRRPVTRNSRRLRDLELHWAAIWYWRFGPGAGTPVTGAPAARGRASPGGGIAHGVACQHKV